MKAFKCDRCGSFFLTKKVKSSKYYISASRNISGSYLDLCCDCQQQLEEFVEAYKVQEAKEEEEIIRKELEEENKEKRRKM